tara:strand:- start:3605 stop:4771 length:1167 start_codon:yes stop_codon:yes gene_type:complete
MTLHSEPKLENPKMPGIPKGNVTPLARRLLVSADLEGDANGLASQQEVSSLHTSLQETMLPSYDLAANERKQATAQLLGQTDVQGIETLAPELQTLPSSIQRLALEVDGLWGDADGNVSVEEIDRVAQYYLSALPFFTPEANDLLELAEHLKLGGEQAASQTHTGQPKKAPSVMALRVALAKVDEAEIEDAKPFRELFDEAIEEAEVAGAPELLRDAAKHNPKWHRLSILEHTGAAVRAAHNLCDFANVDWKDAGGAMLLHDVGKILERQVRHEGDSTRFSFWDHEEDGAKWLEERGLSDELVFQIHHHSVMRKKSVDEMVALAGNDDDRLARMVIVYISDQLGKGDTPDQVNSFNQQRPKLVTLANRAGLDGEALLSHAEQLREQWY